jgi:hypothetical protein
MPSEGDHIIRANKTPEEARRVHEKILVPCIERLSTSQAFAIAVPTLKYQNRTIGKQVNLTVVPKN